MATKRWIGNAANVAQVDSVAFADVWASADTCTAIVNGKSLVVTMGTAITDNEEAAVAFKKAWNGTSTATNEYTYNFDASEHGEFAEITASIDAATPGTVVLTGDTAGKPFTITSVGETTAGSGTATLSAEDTAATGMWHLTDVENWDGGVIPVDDDDIIFDRGNTPMLYGLSQAAVTLTSLTIRSEYTGWIGLPRVNVDNAALPYNEYRTRAWTTGAAADANDVAIKIGAGSGAGPGRVVMNLGDSDFTAEIFGGGPIYFAGTATTPEITIHSGDLRLGMHGDAVTLTKLQLGSGALVTLGAGVTWTSGGEVTNQGGTLVGTVDVP